MTAIDHAIKVSAEEAAALIEQLEQGQDLEEGYHLLVLRFLADKSEDPTTNELSKRYDAALAARIQ